MRVRVRLGFAFGAGAQCNRRSAVPQAMCGSGVRRHLARARRLGECRIAASVVRVRLDVLQSLCIACASCA